MQELALHLSHRSGGLKQEVEERVHIHTFMPLGYWIKIKKQYSLQTVLSIFMTSFSPISWNTHLVIPLLCCVLPVIDSHVFVLQFEPFFFLFGAPRLDLWSLKLRCFSKCTNVIFLVAFEFGLHLVLGLLGSPNPQLSNSGLGTFGWAL